MKVIIAYASAGAGHFKAAQSISDYLKDNRPDLKTQLIDILDYSSPFFRLSYIGCYHVMVSYFPWVWQFFFTLTSSVILRRLVFSIRTIVDRLNTRQFINFLVREKPDYLISTHFLPSLVTSYLKSVDKIDAKLFTVITDFVAHPFWLVENTDLYVVATDFTRQDLLAHGVNSQKIEVFGIPIAQKFTVKCDRQWLRQKLQLKDRFTVFLITGSFGIGPIEEIVDKIHNQAQLLVVCARNHELFTRLKEKNYQDLKVFGFVDNIEELMSLSDIIITKPGGLTIAELLAMELVPIFISAIPGQETGNLKALEYYGIGSLARTTEEIEKALLYYSDHPDELSRVKENMRKISKVDAAAKLANVIR
jgi:processive 1,2-diacylglycerol beta-glucosyltransferase